MQPDFNGLEVNPLIEEQIRNLMAFLDLNHVLHRIGHKIDKEMDWNWNDCLSPGEQQRISFVRLLYHRPLLAVLDESTSAVSLDMEDKMYQECKRLKITMISCGHRESLRQYHTKVLSVFKNTNSDSLPSDYTIESL